MKSEIQTAITELQALKTDDDLGFRRLLGNASGLCNLDPRLTRDMGVGRPTLQRWLEGKSIPHPAVRQFVIDCILKALKETIDGSVESSS
jgi:hypothetical protein